MMMDIPYSRVEGVRGFWTRVLNAQRRILLLDYDGTLAPFQADRMQARPLEGIAPVLSDIVHRGTTRVVIVSGRPISELDVLLDSLSVEMIGSHGYEFRDSRSNTRHVLPESLQSIGFGMARRYAADAGYSANIEQKTGSIAFHYRGFLDETGLNAVVRSLWNPIADEFDLDLRDFNGGVELRARGIDKGTAIKELLRSEPAEAFIVYLGDDDTDEDAFAAIQERGIGIKVGGYGLKTYAAGRLPNCEAVRDFLRTWHAATG